MGTELRTAGEEPGTRTAEVHLHTEHRVGRVDERIFGGFLEHMGRAVYEGVFDPGNPASDANGFRSDVLDALRPLRMPLVRYPGGNFVSAYDWRDGVGPVKDRPVRPEFAWRSIETNRFGTDEFMAWCEELGTAPMMAVNLGTGTPADVAGLVEYCNLPGGTALADQRAAHGHPDPYGVRVWCLGNEMDGTWQAGHVPAATYAERALVASQLMKGLDPTIETVVCGSSHRLLPTYMTWDRTVLEHCWDNVDYISAHRYSRNDHDDVASFLAEGVIVDEILDQYRALLTYVRAIRRSGGSGSGSGGHDVHVSFDEWNVWYREMGQDGGWQQAPHLLEEVYNVEDALVCAQYLHAFLRHADIVRIACLAQIVNVIAPVLTRPDGVLVQSIYWPFRMLRDTAGTLSLQPVVRAPEATTRRGDVPVLDAAATFDEMTGALLVSLVNRQPDAALAVTVAIPDRLCTVDAVELLHGHPKNHNSWSAPDVVAPTAAKARVDEAGRVVVNLPPVSHAVLRLSSTAR